MKKFKFLNITAIMGLFIGAATGRLMAQEESYDDVIAQIKKFENQKLYTVSNTGPMLDSIISGIIQNDGGYLCEGLDRRLVGYVSAAKILKQAATAETPSDGNLLELLFYTRQAPVPVFITDVGLKGRVVQNGAAIKRAEAGFWDAKDINKTNVIQALEVYPPETAVVLVDIISRPWYQAGGQVYENIDTSWASQSLWDIFYSAREIELAKRSVVVKLLANQGYITLPSVVYADFVYSGWPSIPIYLDSVTWSVADVPALQRLLSNPYYSAAANAELQNLGY